MLEGVLLRNRLMSLISQLEEKTFLSWAAVAIGGIPHLFPR